MSETGLRSASTDEDIAAIRQSTPEVQFKHLIIGGRSGTGLGAARALASRGEGVLFTHSGSRKPNLIEKALAEVRGEFDQRPAGMPGDPELDVITIGGDAASQEHQVQILEAASLWLGSEAVLKSVSLMAARGTDPTKLGVTPTPEDLLEAERKAQELNCDALVEITHRLIDAETDNGLSRLAGATVIYPTSNLAHQWDSPGGMQPDWYEKVGRTKMDAFDALMLYPRERLQEVGGRLITVVMGIVDGTLVATGVQRYHEEYLELDEAKRTEIDTTIAGESIADIVHDPQYDNGAVLAILRDRIERLAA